LKKRATVFTNDPRHPQLMLSVAGRVEQFADIHPERIILRGTGDLTIRQELVVTPRASYPFKVTAVRAKNGTNIRFEMHEKDTPEGKSYIISVENTKTTPGKYYDNLLLSTDSKLKPILPIHVYGTIAAAQTKEAPKP
jgi:hypothetical protein